MKICIITQPLHTNYGGLLQAYALQRTLAQMGFDVVTARDGVTRRRSLPRFAYFLFYAYKRYLRGDKRFNPYRFCFRSLGRKIEQQERYVAEDCDKFIDEYISTINLFTSRDKTSRQIISSFDMVVVGSDQVWRAEYADPATYFLDFAKGLELRRIAYAASFGIATLEGYTAAQKAQCAELANYFDAISVRERSGVELMHENFAVEVEQVADPTMLLDVADYLAIASSASREEQIVSYILDLNSEKQKTIDNAKKYFDLAYKSLTPTKRLEQRWQSLDECRFAGVDEWLGSIASARYVVTDSFHGTVFALLFNRDFVVVDNAERGSERLTSLLERVGLTSRIIATASELTPDILEQKIDYTTINPKINEWRNESREWLEKALKIHNS